jgi:hypothetical protein
MEKVLGRTAEGDVTIACWEAGQTSPYHCHPDATEIYFCFEGGGTMRTPERDDCYCTGDVRRPSARRIARIRQRVRAYRAVPRSLWRGDVRPDQGMARQPELEGASRGSRIL